MRGRPQEVLCSAYFLHNGIRVLHGNNLASLYKLSSVYIGRNWVDK